VLIPIKDDQPTRRTPHLTIGLIFINTAVFLYSQTLGMEGFNEFIYSLGYKPYFFLDLGANYRLPTWYLLTPLTSMFVHGGWMHLIGNMLFLWIFGNNIEDYFGPIKYLLFYIISGLAAVTMYTLFNPNSQVPLIGASGAIAGVMGAYMVLHPRARITVLIIWFIIMFRNFSAKTVLGVWFLFQVLMSVLNSQTGGGTAWLAHVGGFIFGYLVLWTFIKIRGGGPTDRQYRVYWRQ
jgi:membrane associated rhomboid family serine protease